MKFSEKTKIEKWLDGKEDKPKAIVTAIASGAYDGFGQLSKDEVDKVIPKLEGLDVYIGHQTTPDDRVGKISKAWLEVDEDTKKHRAKTQIDIDEESPCFEKIKGLIKDNTCDSVSLTFRYTKMGSGELVDMVDLAPAELSFVEEPICEDCAVDIASFSKNGEKKKEFITKDKEPENPLEDGFARLQHVSNFRLSKNKKPGQNKIRIYGVALKPGVYKYVEYTWEAIKNSAPSLVGQSLTIDHSRSARDVVGKITDAWADEEARLVLFSGYVDDLGIAQKIETGSLDAISPEVKYKVVGDALPLSVDNVLFTGMSIIARPACKECRLTTKSLDYLEKIRAFYESAQEKAEQAQEAKISENYIKDNRDNNTIMVMEETKGEVTMSDEVKVTAEPKVEEPKVEAPQADAPKVETPEAQPVKTEAKPAEKPAEPKAAEPKTEKPAEIKVKDVALPEEKQVDQVVDAIKKKEKKEIDDKLTDDQKRIAKLSDDLKKLEDQWTEKYTGLEGAYKEVLAENIHAKEKSLGFNVPHDRMEKLKDVSVEVLNELWANVKDMTPSAQFGHGPKGISTAVPHTEEAEKPKKDKMQEIYDNL